MCLTPAIGDNRAIALNAHVRRSTQPASSALSWREHHQKKTDHEKPNPDSIE